MAKKVPFSYQTPRRLPGSIPVVGSSNKMRAGSPISAVARLIRRFCPPERVSTGSSFFVVRASSASRRSHSTCAASSDSPAPRERSKTFQK